jgi:hypothetical protein
MNHPYEYVKPADNAENYQFTLCSAYGVPLEVGKNNWTVISATYSLAGSLLSTV